MSVVYMPHSFYGEDNKMEFESIDAMKDFIVAEHEKRWEIPMFGKDDIVIEDEVEFNLPRCYKKMQLVCVKKYWNEDYIELYGCPQCMGYCSINNEE